MGRLRISILKLHREIGITRLFLIQVRGNDVISCLRIADRIYDLAIGRYKRNALVSTRLFADTSRITTPASASEVACFTLVGKLA